MSELRWWRAKGGERITGVYAWCDNQDRPQFELWIYYNRCSVATAGCWYAGPVEMPDPETILPPLPEFKLPEWMRHIAPEHKELEYHHNGYWRCRCSPHHYWQHLSHLVLPPHPDPPNSLHRRRDDGTWESV